MGRLLEFEVSWLSFRYKYKVVQVKVAERSRSVEVGQGCGGRVVQVEV